jgi:hypothetical protein
VPPACEQITGNQLSIVSASKSPAKDYVFSASASSGSFGGNVLYASADSTSTSNLLMLTRSGIECFKVRGFDVARDAFSGGVDGC